MLPYQEMVTPWEFVEINRGVPIFISLVVGPAQRGRDNMVLLTSGNQQGSVVLAEVDPRDGGQGLCRHAARFGDNIAIISRTLLIQRKRIHKRILEVFE